MLAHSAFYGHPVIGTLDLANNVTRDKATGHVVIENADAP